MPLPADTLNRVDEKVKSTLKAVKTCLRGAKKYPRADAKLELRCAAGHLADLSRFLEREAELTSAEREALRTGAHGDPPEPEQPA